MSASTRSQCDKILGYLESGGVISPLLALHAFGCFRLGARVWDLRRQGYPITREIVTDRATGKRFAAYRMEGA